MWRVISYVATRPIATAALLLLLGATLSSAGQPEPSLRLLAIYGAGHAMDEASTEYALHHNPNASEANALLRSAPLRVGAHLSAVVFETWATRRLQRDGHPGWARALKWTVVAKGMAAGVINLRAARQRQ